MNFGIGFSLSSQTVLGSVRRLLRILSSDGQAATAETKDGAAVSSNGQSVTLSGVSLPVWQDGQTVTMRI